MYCGDETGSFIGDIGTYNSRFGYGGYDCPTYVVPSYVATVQDNQQQQQQSATSTTSTTRTVSKKRCIPTSCYNGKWNNPNYCESFDTPLRTSSAAAESKNSNNNNNNNNNNNRSGNSNDQTSYQPVIDPDDYLSYGDCISNWDAYEYMWQSSFETLRVNDPNKHRNFTTTTTTTTNPASGIQSTTIQSNTGYTEGKCIHPLLVVSPGHTYTVGTNPNLVSDGSLQSNAFFSTRKQRNREMVQITELLMEKFQCTSMFIVPTPMTMAFSVGRQTGTVVDIGASGCRVTPIVDGIVLYQSQRRNGRGGTYLSNVQWHVLNTILQHNNNNNNQQQQSSFSSSLIPRYQLSKAYKQQQQQLQQHNNITTTGTSRNGIFHRWAMEDLMYEFRTSAFMESLEIKSNNTDAINTKNNNASSSSIPPLFSKSYNSPTRVLSDSPMSTTTSSSDSTTSALPNWTSCYELPDGTYVDTKADSWSNDLCRIYELLFTPTIPFINSSSTASAIVNEHSTLSNAALPQLIKDALSSVGDVDVRKELTNNIIVAGGMSCMKGFDQRLSYELTNRTISSAYKCRVIASKNTTERTYGAWIGASILSSLGSFQQLWLSSTEYNEYGPAISVQRFP